MKTLVEITTETMNERNLTYSPELFNEVMKEVKVKFESYNNKRNDWLDSIETKKVDYLVSFLNNNLTTDKRLK